MKRCPILLLPLTAVCLTLLLCLLPGGRERRTGPEGAKATVTPEEPASLPDRTRGDEAVIARLGPESRAFRLWVKSFEAAVPEHRAAMLAEGRRLAGAHRQRIKQLITDDPRRALEEAVPVVVRQDLPPEIGNLLEERVNAAGFYGVLGQAPAAGMAGGIQRIFETPDGRRYDARVYGWRVQQMTGAGVPVHGVAVDGMLAVHKDPLRLRDPRERLRPEQTVKDCPVLKKGIHDSAVAAMLAEAGGEVYRLCCEPAQALRARMVAAEGGTGGPTLPTGEVSADWSTGVKSVLYIRATFPDQNEDPHPETDAYETMRQVNDFFVANSHGRLHIMTTVTPVIMMPKTEAWYRANDNATAAAILTDARAAARAAGYDYAAYDLEAVRYNGASGTFGGGQAFVGSRGCWLKTGAPGLVAHELGHNLGQWHANYWNTGGESVTGAGTNAEYGHTFDTMGASNAGDYFFNAGQQQRIHWLSGENAVTAAGSGTYRIYQQDQPRVDPSRYYLLKVPKDAQREYWFEFRQRFTDNPWLMNGLSALWGPWGDAGTAATTWGSNGGPQLLDMTPGSGPDRDDSPLVAGRTFTDPEAQMHITPVGRTGTVPESMDVVIHRGTFPGNRSPEWTAAPGAVTAAPGQAISFTAGAADPDGDVLAYAWDWGDDTFGVNRATVSKAWSDPGIYAARCEVSDMRGGKRSVLFPVTVGTPAGFTIKGRVLAAGNTPVAGVRVHNRLIGFQYHGCETDSEGNYLLTGLPAGAVFLAAQVRTHECMAGFTNPVNLSGNVTGVDFTAVPKTLVTMTAPDAVCGEAGGTALLRFTRTPPFTEALEVRALAGGSADIYDMEYTPADEYLAGLYGFVIPAGEASVEIVVDGLDDDTEEGPETWTLHLMETEKYLPSAENQVTLLIEDDDSELPVVSIAAVHGTAREGGAAGRVKVSRTGPVEAALEVALTQSGSAVPGTDCTGPGGTATIPAGQVFAEFTVTALPDALVEGTETAVFTLGTGPDWLVSPLAAAAELAVLDDDIPVVTLTAADASAAEADSDPAVFIVSRTGDLTAPLTVDYALGGPALHGTDYQPLAGSVVIPAGLRDASVVITPVDDTMGEPDQTVTMQLCSNRAYLAGTPSAASAVITDNDQPRVMVHVTDGFCTEGSGSGRFRIQSLGTGSGTVIVSYTVSGTATPGTDYTVLSGIMEVPVDGFADILVLSVHDTLKEDAESVTLTLTPGANYTLSPEQTATLFITDDDQPMVSVAAGKTAYAEHYGPAKFYVSRNNPGPALTVEYTLSGTATAGADYGVMPGSVVIPAGVMGAGIDVPLFNDAGAEGAETLICTLVTAGGNYGAYTPSVQVLITDTDDAGLPSIRFAAETSTGEENAGTVNIEVRREGNPSGEVRVNYALESGAAFNGVDCRAAGGTLVFASGETVKTIPVEIIDDGFREPEEDVSFKLTAAFGAKTGEPAVHTLTITDNDPAPAPVTGFAAAASVAGEGGGATAQALVFLSAPQTAPVSVHWAVTGGTASAADTGVAEGTLTFLPGETAKPVPLAVIDDDAQEAAETVILTLTNPSAPAQTGPQMTHTVSIVDDDSTVVTVTATVAAAAEAGPVNGSVTVTRATTGELLPVTVALVVGGTATPVDDYMALPAEVLIPAGQLSVVVPVVPRDDYFYDPAETVTVTVGPSPFYKTGTPSLATVTIGDDEATFAHWQQWRFAGQAGDPLVAGPRADADRDGLENLVEYALGGDPQQPDAGHGPSISRQGDVLRLLWRQAAGVPDVEIVPEWSAGLTAWNPNGLTVETVTSGPGWVEKRASLNIAARSRVTLRLRVTLP